MSAHKSILAGPVSGQRFSATKYSDILPVLNFFLVTINSDDLSTCKPDEGEKSKTDLRCEVLDERDANDNAP